MIFYWGVAMKQVDGLQRIKGWMDASGQPYASMRVLIIDDESDSATPDSSARDQGNLPDDAIAEEVEAIGSTPGFEDLGAWFELLRERSWPDIGAETPEAETFRGLCDELTGNGTIATKWKAIVNSAECRAFLDMNDLADPPIHELVESYFNKTKGRGERSHHAFVLLLKSIIGVSRDRSAVNSAVCRMVGTDPETGEYAYPFSRCAYVGYTATPYANILNEGPSQTPIYPDFIHSLEIPPQYFGAEAIFGRDIASPESRMPVVRPITDAEEDGILAPLQNDGTLYADEDLVCKTEDGSLEWKSLKDAISWAFCTAAARRLARLAMTDATKRAKLENRWTTLIVNVQHTRGAHGLVNDAIGRYIKARRATPESREAFGAAYR